MRAVAQEFGLDENTKVVDLNSAVSLDGREEKQSGFGSDPAEESPLTSRPLTVEEMRRRAAADWRRKYYDNRTNEREAEPNSSPGAERSENEKKSPERDAGLDFEPD